MKTIYYANKALNHFTKVEQYQQPEGLYLALFTEEPGRYAPYKGEVENYTRQKVSFAPSDNGISRSSEAIVFPKLPNVTIKYWGLYDALTGGNLLEYFKLQFDWVIAPGVEKEIGAGDLIIREE